MAPQQSKKKDDGQVVNGGGTAKSAPNSKAIRRSRSKRSGGSVDTKHPVHNLRDADKTQIEPVNPPAVVPKQRRPRSESRKAKYPNSQVTEKAPASNINQRNTRSTSAGRRAKSESVAKVEVTSTLHLESTSAQAQDTNSSNTVKPPRSRSRKKSKGGGVLVKTSPFVIKDEVEASQPSPAVEQKLAEGGGIFALAPPVLNDMNLTTCDSDLQISFEQALVSPSAVTSRRANPKAKTTTKLTTTAPPIHVSESSESSLVETAPLPAAESDATIPNAPSHVAPAAAESIPLSEVRMPRRSRKKNKVEDQSSVISSPKTEHAPEQTREEEPPSVTNLPEIKATTAKSVTTQAPRARVKKRSRNQDHSLIVVPPGKRPISNQVNWIIPSDASSRIMTSSSGVSCNSTIKVRKRRLKSSPSSLEKKSPSAQLLLRNANKRRRRLPKSTIYEDALLPIGDLLNSANSNQDIMLDEAGGQILSREGLVITSSDGGGGGDVDIPKTITSTTTPLPTIDQHSPAPSLIVTKSDNMNTMDADSVIMQKTSPFKFLVRRGRELLPAKPSAICQEICSALTRLKSDLKELEECIESSEQQSQSGCSAAAGSTGAAAPAPHDLTSIFWLPFTAERQYIWSDLNIDRSFKGGAVPAVSTDVLGSGLLSKTSCSSLF